MLNLETTSLHIYNEFLQIYHNNNVNHNYIYNNNNNNNNPSIVDFVNHVYRLKTLFIPPATISRMLLTVYQTKLFYFINQENQQSVVTELVQLF